MSVFRFTATSTSTPLPRKARGRSVTMSPPSVAFSTSPSILQDITLDRSEMDARGSAATGLTMKEYDEQLKKLTADNFHLKLKIYFMDNRISQMEGIQDKDLIKENIDLRIINETQAKELEGKLKLLFEASEAFEQLQKEHAEELTKLKKQHEKERNEYELKLGALEANLKVTELRSESCSNEEIENYLSRIQELEECLKSEEKKVIELTAGLEKRELTYLAAESQIRDFIEKERCLSEKVKELEVYIQESEVEILAAENSKLKEEIVSLRDTISNDLQKKLEENAAEIATLKQENSKGCATIKSFLRRVQSERNEKERISEVLKEKEKLVEDLYSRIESSKYDSQATNIVPQKESNNCHCAVRNDMARIQNLEAEVAELKAQQDDSPHENLAVELEAKKCEIQKLNSDLKKRTHYLQELVNKELWDKNRQIEKLEKRLEETGRANALELEELKARLNDVIEERAVLQREVAGLREREDPLRQACSILTIRLEELAGFLDSLLTDRELLGLDMEKHEIIREAVERSRELSRNLTLGLEDSLLVSEASTLVDQSNIISKLREQLSVLTEQVRQRDIELSRCQRDSTTLSSLRDEDDSPEFVLSIPLELDERWLQVNECDENERVSNMVDRRRSSRMLNKSAEKTLTKQRPTDASESEAWSEPDRDVSLARMGRLDSCSITPLRLSKCPVSSDSDETLHDGRTSGKRTRSADSETRKLQAKVRQLEEQNKSLRGHIAVLEKKHTILNHLGGESAPELLLEIQQSLTELEESRDTCKRLRKELAATQADLSIYKEDLEAKESACKEHVKSISSLESKLDEITLDYELRLAEATLEKESLEKRSSEMQVKFEQAEALRTELEHRVAEIDKKVADSHRFKTESSAQVREAAKYVDTAERLMLDAKRDKTESERKIRELQQFVEALKKEVDEKTKELDNWTLRASREKEEAQELKRRLLEAERSKVAVELKVKEAKEQIQWMDGKLRELEQVMDQCEREMQARIADEVKKGVEAKTAELKRDWVERVQLEEAERMNEKLESMVKTAEGQKKVLQESAKAREDDLMKRIYRIDGEKRELWRQLDELRVQGSEMELELSRLTNDKVQLEETLRKAVEKQNTLLRNHQHAEEKFLHTIRNLEKQVDEEVTGASTTNDVLWVRNLNTSPDLGIDSDHGRFSSLEHQDQKPTSPNNNTATASLEEENIALRRRLSLLQQTLEQTMADLQAANHYKKQMERAVCKQLHKTHHILKKARINFEMRDSDSVEEQQ